MNHRLAVVFIALLTICIRHVTGAESMTASEKILQQAATTDAIWTQTQQLEQSWRDERMRLQLLIQSLQDHAATLQTDIDETEQATQTLVAKMGAEQASVQEMSAFLDRSESLAAQIETAVNRQRSSTVLQLHGTALQAAPTASALETAFTNLADAERASRQIAVRTGTGTTTEGHKRGVEFLCFGGAQAWWRAPDNSEAGTVLIKDGQVLVQPSPSSEAQNSLIKAFQQREGNSEAALVELPKPGVSQ